MNRLRFCPRNILIPLALLLGAVGLIACNASPGKPTVVIISPPSGSQYHEGEDVAVQSTATDTVGVVRMELVVDGNVVRVDPSPTAQGQPLFSLIQTWKATQGTHTILVRAYNAAGTVSDPAGISISVLQGIALAGTPTTAPALPSATSTATTTGAPPATTTSASPSATVAGACSNNAAFVADVTVPDGTVFTAGQAFDKKWKMSNNGTCAWGTGYQFVFVGGEAMATSTVVAVPNTAPGASVDLLVPMTAPVAPGSHTGQWQMRSPTGGLFGQKVSVKITVPGAPAPTATATNTPPPSGCIGTPNIASFTPNPPTITAGGTSNLQWGAVTNADSVEIDHGIGGVPAPGNANVSPASTTTYTMTAHCGANTATKQATVTVNPASSPSTSQVFAQATIGAGLTGSTFVACPAGSVVTSGGYASSSSFDVYNSSKDGNGWRVYAKNNSGGGALLNSYAICLSNTSGATQQPAPTQVSVPAGGTLSATVSCPSGVATGGGFAFNIGGKVFTQDKIGNGWEVFGYNSTAAPLLLNAYVVCLTGTSATTAQSPVAQVSVPAHAVGSATANCPSGIITGGGFASQSSMSTKVYTHSKTAGQGWEVFLDNQTASSQLVNSYAICASF